MIITLTTSASSFAVVFHVLIVVTISRPSSTSSVFITAARPRPWLRVGSTATAKTTCLLAVLLYVIIVSTVARPSRAFSVGVLAIT
jgi:hypothetical protein